VRAISVLPPPSDTILALRYRSPTAKESCLIADDDRRRGDRQCTVDLELMGPGVEQTDNGPSRQQAHQRDLGLRSMSAGVWSALPTAASGAPSTPSKCTRA
jgi:hypothetical protein